MASEDDSSWVKELEEALLDDCDLGTIREICQGRPVPEQLRAKTWQVCLRISSKGDALSGFDELFDMSEQQLLRDNCTSLVDKLGNDEEDRVSVTSDLESLLTFYCKSRSVMYKADNGWIDVLQPMLALKLSRSDLYNCFYALQQRFIPRECHKNGRPFHLFRLLLLYHDPELCSFLDSKRVLPDTYGLKWFNTLFSSICDLNVTLALWDVYLMTSDPFLLFFLPLVLLVNSKDAILEMDKSSKQEIVDYISALPSDIAADDIEDFFGLSQVYSKKTPQSFRRDYQQPLFGTHSSNGMGDVTSQVSQALCLPVSANELMMAKQNQEEDGVRYFVVDCRPADQYNNGHLNTAFHLDANLMLQNPEDFSVAVQALLNAQQQALDAGSSAGGRHLCFLGSGREQEDQYVHMVIANFLQKNTQFVCLIRNGYRALHDLLRDNLSLLSDHNPRLCLVCTPDASLSDTESNEDFISDQANSLMSKFSSVVKIKGAVMKEKISNYIKNEYGPDTERHVSNRDKVGKPYRSQTNMFSIDDDGDDDEFSESGSESDQRDVVNIETWLNKSDTKASFPCKHIVNNGYMCDRQFFHSSHLIVTDTHLFVLREISGRSGMAWIQARRALGSIVKITSKKRQPEVITFKYGSNDEQQGVEITDLDRFYIPRAGEATKTIKTYVIKVLDALGDS